MTRTFARTSARALCGLVVVSGIVASTATRADEPQRGKASLEELSQQIDQIKRQIDNARNNIDLVEKQYTLRDEPSEETALMQRYSDGEVQYLLGDYQTASVLFYDLVANKTFQAMPKYGDALFFLADALYQQKNFLGARLYLRQLLTLRAGHYREALTRYLEIAGRMNEFAGIDDFIAQAKGLSGGQLPPELTYVYAKWLFRREDLTLEDRMARAQTIFNTLATDAQGPYHMQSAYFIGVGYVKLKQWNNAIEQFRAVGKMKPRDDRDRRVLEMSQLSMGRVYFEIGKYDEAIDSYARIPQNSENFPDSLYEIAWANVRKGELQKAKNATDVLLLVAEGSVLDPEARILSGTLQQKLQKYEEAIETYNTVINKYGPVYQEINELIIQNRDPEQYFEQLLTRNEKSLDVTKLLPAEALKWASTREDVADAVQITSNLDEGRKGLDESRQIAERILRSLDERGLESFPMLQEGFTRADAVDTSITRSEEGLTRIEGYVADAALSADQRRRLAEVREKETQLKRRIETLPTTAEQVKARRERIQAGIDNLDKRAFQLGLDLQSLNAQVVAIRKFVDDLKTEKKTKQQVEDEKAFLEQVNNVQRELEAHEQVLTAMRAHFMEERNNADKAISGEAELRKEYADVIEEERSILSQVRASLGSDVSNVLRRADVVREDALAVRERVLRSKTIIRERVAKNAQRLREQVIHEQELLETYTKEADSVTGDTRNLVGRIAYDSFKRVRQSFYDLVLKADVGVVDVSFQRKQDKTTSIQKLAAQKDRELRQLDDEFKEVLKDVE